VTDTAVPLPLVDVTRVEVIGDHRLRLTFADGIVGDVAFGDHEWRGVFEPLADPGVFAESASRWGRSPGQTASTWHRSPCTRRHEVIQPRRRRPTGNAATPSAQHRGGTFCLEIHSVMSCGSNSVRPANLQERNASAAGELVDRRPRDAKDL
jgi:hypothetical protein